MTKRNLQITCRKDNIVTAHNISCFTMQLSTDIQTPQPKINWQPRESDSSCYIARPSVDGYIAVRALEDGSFCMSYIKKDVLVFVATESNGNPTKNYHIAHLYYLLKTVCTTNSPH